MWENRQIISVLGYLLFPDSPLFGLERVDHEGELTLAQHRLRKKFLEQEFWGG